jgi:hypothetical protein
MGPHPLVRESRAVFTHKSDDPSDRSNYCPLPQTPAQVDNEVWLRDDPRPVRRGVSTVVKPSVTLTVLSVTTVLSLVASDSEDAQWLFRGPSTVC